MYVFDSSSIINIVKRGATRVFEQGVTLDLAVYETLNAIWKEHNLLNRIDRETALMYVEVLTKVFEGLRIESIRGFEKEVLDLACREEITIYDASYLYLALKNKLVLVTDDEKLREKASKYVETLDSNYIVRKHRNQ